MTRTSNVLSRVLVPVFAFGLLAIALAHAAPAEAQRRGYYSRSRLGVQGDIGYVRESNNGLVLGITGQIGVQQSDLFAIYYQPRLLAGSFFDGDNNATVVAFYNTAMFDFTFGDIFQIGLGPSLDLGVAGVCRRDSCDGFGGAFFGADFKIALAFGHYAPGRQRAGFVLALHAHPTWLSANDPVTTVTLGFGYQVY
jgi:hypothetical protein